MYYCTCSEQPQPANETASPGAPPAPGRQTPGGAPQNPPTGSIYQVTFENIEVTAAEDGFGSTQLETHWTFTVNGQSQVLEINPLDLGTTPLGITFFVETASLASSILIEVSGMEIDNTPDWPGIDDPLPGFSHAWYAGQNFGQGAHSELGSNKDITYKMNYTITSAQETVMTVTRETLLAFGQDRARSKGVDFESASAPSSAMLLNWGLDRLQKNRWELIQTTADEFVLKGYGNLPQQLEKSFRDRQIG